MKEQFHMERDRLRGRGQQQNERLLQVFEGHGELEQIIVDLYKKY